ncbi:MAG: RidA family protein [Gammaproteobacteria bacterium]|nr:RidA family protein [Gammaproteobacteria bacterium]NKB64096.1 RidA family protein [Gammaproteobacteria bacterium]
MTDNIESRLKDLGYELPPTVGGDYYGTLYGTMKPYHIVGPVLHLSGHVPIRNGKPIFPGRLGETVTIEQGQEAAELTAMNAIAGMRQALGDLDRVVSIIKSLNFVACAPDFTDVHMVSTAMANRFVEVFGEERGVGCRATIGVQNLASNFCFETWIEVEIK